MPWASKRQGTSHARIVAVGKSSSAWAAQASRSHLTSPTPEGDFDFTDFLRDHRNCVQLQEMVGACWRTSSVNLNNGLQRRGARAMSHKIGKSRSRADVMATDAECIYCGQPHYPPRAYAAYRHVPDARPGERNATCAPCNNGTSAVDLVASFMARIYTAPKSSTTRVGAQLVRLRFALCDG